MIDWLKCFGIAIGMILSLLLAMSIACAICFILPVYGMGRWWSEEFGVAWIISSMLILAAIPISFIVKDELYG